MDIPQLLGGIGGGIGLFLLGMGLMTDGLKQAAGPALERILSGATRTPLWGLGSGIAVTALVQSSTAVTVATIGFVNAGLLSLYQALWVIFGANVGTTMTGWLVALVGLKFKIEALALPLIGLGALLRLTGESSRRGALGTALAGFGLLFLGIDMLKEVFSGVSTDFKLPEGSAPLDTLIQVLIGFLLTVIMQSSSASLTVALTAAEGGMIGPYGAAAVVIGANVGTTVTAIVAVIGATSNAKRTGAAHILFNLLTGCVALLLLPWLVDALTLLRAWLGLPASPAAELALFHTVFNVMGVILIWPLSRPLTRFLEARFRTAEEDDARPRFIDKTVLAVPVLALDALEQEVRRMGCIARRSLGEALSAEEPDRLRLARASQAVGSLNRSIASFIIDLYRAQMSIESARRLPELLRIARYYETATGMARAAAESLQPGGMPESARDRELHFRNLAQQVLALVDPEHPLPPGEVRQHALATLLESYHQLKAALLSEGARGALAVDATSAWLHRASVLRRGLEQCVRAADYLGRQTTDEGNRTRPDIPSPAQSE
ncbi:Na/Pi cotransporter family protein [Zoogloea sp.]|uniref:Na/Pi cotransporter family protein n=1 Tax=Zoogloea sp. TaxID=49181 RepID=UPI00261C1388|nr:Na/Pi cotransporter family protein [Zoogloea sp.]MDD3355217.1 Na/Pi cotransporter family protein [Zoogloea sp.]